MPIPVPAISTRVLASTTLASLPFIAPKILVSVASLVTVIFSSMLIAPAVSVKAREAPLIPLVASTAPTVSPVAIVLAMCISPPASTARVSTAELIISTSSLAINLILDAEREPPCWSIFPTPLPS